MSFKAYKYTFKLHISHSINISEPTKAHFHTIKIVLYIKNNSRKEFRKYDDIEKVVNNFLMQYEGKYINNTELFKNYTPTIENIGRIFYSRLKQILENNDFNLLKLEINETPARIFCISENNLLS